MQKIVLIVFALTTTLFVNAQSPSFKTYINPVIPGDHPDCTITKVENDFYTTGSSFNPTPKIYHSTDLVHWETISQPVNSAWSGYGDTPGGGCWGGHVVFYNNEYWDFFGLGANMYFVKTKDPKGPWSDPIKLKNPSSISYSLGRDNSIFIDEDNKWYLLVKSGQPNNGIVELGVDGQPTGFVFDLNWLNPKISEPSNYKYSWAEGPVMWKYGGYYYYSFALNTAGGQKVMRSKTLSDKESDWEFLGDLFNESDPLKGGSLFTGPNHASPAVLLDDSTSWLLHPVYAKDDWRGQGRQGLLNQVKYNAKGKPIADYPVNQPFTAPKLPSSGIPWMVPKSDFFSSESLNPEWSFLGLTPKSKYSLTERPGWLRLTPKSSSKANTLVKNDGEHNYSLITLLDFKPTSAADEAGLWIIRGDAKMSVKLCSTINSNGKKGISFSFNGKEYEVENSEPDTIWLKIVRVNHQISGFYSRNGMEWIKVGDDFNTSVIDSYSDNTFTVWEGTRQGLYVQGTSEAYFDLYIYRDAYTPILAECPANQLGTTRSSISQGIRILKNIHPIDWALYAGVEFGNNEYGMIPDSVEFTASSTTSGGIIEVWLDSIDTGTKIAECAISNTGSLNTYQTFKTSVLPVSGNHDVYLKFNGTGTDVLFQLKWFNFIRKPNQPNSSQIIEKFKKLSIYPNPAKNEVSIQTDFLFDTIEIFGMNGKQVIQQGLKDASNSSFLSLDLSKGIYLVKVSNGKQVAHSKLIIE